MTRRRKLSPFGNGPVAVVGWWVWNVAWFGGCILATVWLGRLLVAMLWLALVRGVGAP